MNSILKIAGGLTVTALAVSTANAQSLTLNYAREVTVPAGAATTNQGNNMAYDITTGQLAVGGFGTTPSLYLYDAATGDPATPAFLDYTFTSTPGALGGFAIGISDAGEVYSYTQSADPLGTVEKLDSLTDTTGTPITISNAAGVLDTADTIIPADLIDFSRNLDIVGTGADTVIGNVGFGATVTAEVHLLAATDTAATAFEYLGAVVDVDGDTTILADGAGRAGVAISPTTVNGLPEFVAMADALGGISGVKVWETDGNAPTTTNGAIDNYTLISELDGTVPGTEVYRPIDVAIDDTGDFPHVFVLSSADSSLTPATSAAIIAYAIINSSLVEVARLNIDTTALSAPVNTRGSLRVDRTAKTLYAYARGSAGNVILISADYELLAIPATADNAWMNYQ